MTGNDEEALGPVTAGFGPAVNAGKDESPELEELRKSGRRPTGNFNFDLAATAKFDQGSNSSDDEFNPDSNPKFSHLDKKP